jgi:hypothetical protein
MDRIRQVVRLAREHWLIIVAILVNLAIAGPIAADWTDDICYINGKVVPCCVSCGLWCSCGESPAP